MCAAYSASLLKQSLLQCRHPEPFTQMLGRGAAQVAGGLRTGSLCLMSGLMFCVDVVVRLNRVAS